MWEHMSELLSLLAVLISVATYIIGYRDKKKLAIATLENTKARTEETEINSMLKRMVWLEGQVDLLTNENIVLRERVQTAETIIEDLQVKLRAYQECDGTL